MEREAQGDPIPSNHAFLFSCLPRTTRACSSVSFLPRAFQRERGAWPSYHHPSSHTAKERPRRREWQGEREKRLTEIARERD